MAIEPSMVVVIHVLYISNSDSDNPIKFINVL